MSGRGMAGPSPGLSFAGAVAALSCTRRPRPGALACHLPRLLFKAPPARFAAVACTGPLCPPHASLAWHTRVTPSTTVPSRLGQRRGLLLFPKVLRGTHCASSLLGTQSRPDRVRSQGSSPLCPACQTTAGLSRPGVTSEKKSWHARE